MNSNEYELIRMRKVLGDLLTIQDREIVKAVLLTYLKLIKNGYNELRYIIAGSIMYMNEEYNELFSITMDDFDIDKWIKRLKK